MVRIYAPWVIILALILLNFFGGWSRTFPLEPRVQCAYQFAESDAPPADVLFIGASRVGRGIDPGYITERLVGEYGQSITVERLSMDYPFATQFIPLVQRYLEGRGAPKYVLLQLLYNFKKARQRSIDIPINPTRNIAFAHLPELFRIQDEARLNDYNTVLPRTYEKGYRSRIEIILYKIELNIISAIKYPVLLLKGSLVECEGDTTSLASEYEFLNHSIDDSISYEEETPEQMRRRLVNEKIASAFLPLDLLNKNRSYENRQMRKLIDLLEQSGSTVMLIQMPALGETHISESTLNEIAKIFPNNRLIHPYSLFRTQVGEKLSKSYVDTHHANKYGALQFSRFFAEQISLLKF